MTARDQPSGWQPIETAPDEGYVDLRVKRWAPDTDTSDGKRITDCYRVSALWRVTGGRLPDGVRMTHWILPPDPPVTA